METRLRNYARREVEAMPWPSVIADPEGDLRREVTRLQRELHGWRLTVVLLAMTLLIFEVARALGMR